MASATVQGVSSSCHADRHEVCFGFTAESVLLGFDYVETPRADVAPCACACHTGTRTLEINGQRFDYLVPEHPSFTDPDSVASRELAELIRKVIGDQTFAGAWPLNPDEKPARLTLQQNLWPFGMPAIVAENIETEELPRLPMTVEDYGVQALLTRAKFDSANEALVFSALGTSAEAGELANAVRKLAYQGHPMTPKERANLIEEAGDVLWFVNSLLDAVGSNLLEAMQFNSRKLHKRYGGSFSTAKSIARVDVTEPHN